MSKERSIKLPYAFFIRDSRIKNVCVTVKRKSYADLFGRWSLGRGTTKNKLPLRFGKTWPRLHAHGNGAWLASQPFDQLLPNLVIPYGPSTFRPPLDKRALIHATRLAVIQTAFDICPNKTHVQFMQIMRFNRIFSRCGFSALLRIGWNALQRPGQSSF